MFRRRTRPVRHSIDGRADDTPNPGQFSEFDVDWDDTPSANRTPEPSAHEAVEPPSVASGHRPSSHEADRGGGPGTR